MSCHEPLTIWCNTRFPDPGLTILREATQGHRLVLADRDTPADALVEADVAFGQPDPDRLLAAERVRWVHLDSAGYTAYDRDDLRTALSRRGCILTNSSSVFDDPCAHHVLAMMLAFARQLPQSLLNQQTVRGWPYSLHRRHSFLLGGQTALLLGFGSIARRLVELLQPFRMNLVATRRTPRGDEPIPTYPQDHADDVLGDADHVINMLPETEETTRFFTADRFALMKPTALFYNIGRGATVDQDALIDALHRRRIAGAFLDVMTPEPLPPEHPLWQTPNCFITPHTGGGHHDESEQIVRHFLRNLRAYEAGQPLTDRVIA